MSQVAEQAAPSGVGREAPDELDRDRTRRHTRLWIGGFAAVLVVTVPIATGLGPVAISPATVAKIIGHHLLNWPAAVSWTAAQDAIVDQVRVPRVLLGAVVGAGLAVAVTALQAMVRYEAVYPVAAAGGNRTGNVVAVTGDANEVLGAVGETLANVPRLETFQTVSKEVIIGQRPDLVITHGFAGNLEDQLAAQGIKTIIVNTCWGGYAAAHGGHVSFEAIYDDITTFGQLLGTQDYAAKSVDSLKQIVATVSQKAQNLPKQSVAITAGLFSGSFFTYGPPSIANTQLEKLGLTNAFSDLTKRGEEVSPRSSSPATPTSWYSDTTRSPAAQRRRCSRPWPYRDSLR